MENISHLLIRLYVGLTAPRRRTEDGDVPGWVLITVMTAGLVVGIWVFAETTLRDMLSNALNKVK